MSAFMASLPAPDEAIKQWESCMDTPRDGMVWLVAPPRHTHGCQYDLASVTRPLLPAAFGG